MNADREQTDPQAQGYFEYSRNLAVSLLFILPLLVAYEVGLLLVRPSTVSWAGNLVRWVLHSAFGPGAAMVFNLIVILVIAASLLVLRKTGGVRFKTYPAILVESFAYGFLLTQFIPLVIAYAVPLAQSFGGESGGVPTDVILSIGAGVYEEIVFRLGLMSALYFLVSKLSSKRWVAVAAAILISSLVFSASHYVGGVESFTSPDFIRSFTYRTIGGVCFAALYIYRGLAVACYSHAFYDILVVAFG